MTSRPGLARPATRIMRRGAGAALARGQRSPPDGLLWRNPFCGRPLVPSVQAASFFENRVAELVYATWWRVVPERGSFKVSKCRPIGHAVEVEQIWPNLANIDRDSAGAKSVETGFNQLFGTLDRTRPTLARTCPNVGRFRPNFARLRPMLAKNGPDSANLDPHNLGLTRLSSARNRPTLANCGGRARTNLGSYWPKPGNFGPESTRRFRQSLDRIRPHLKVGWGGIAGQARRSFPPSRMAPRWSSDLRAPRGGGG